MTLWRFCGFHPFDLNMLINIPAAEFSSSTGYVNLHLCNFMNKMSNTYVPGLSPLSSSLDLSVQRCQRVVSPHSAWILCCSLMQCLHSEVHSHCLLFNSSKSRILQPPFSAYFSFVQLYSILIFCKVLCAPNVRELDAWGYIYNYTEVMSRGQKSSSRICGCHQRDYVWKGIDVVPCVCYRNTAKRWGDRSQRMRGSYGQLTWVFSLLRYSVPILPIWASFSAALLQLFPASCLWKYALLFPKSLLGRQLKFSGSLYHKIHSLSYILCTYSGLQDIHTLSFEVLTLPSSAVQLRGLDFLCSQWGRQ